MRKLFALFMAAALTAQMLVPVWAEGYPVDPDSAGEPTEDLDAVGDPDPAGAENAKETPDTNEENEEADEPAGESGAEAAP